MLQQRSWALKVEVFGLFLLWELDWAFWWLSLSADIWKRKNQRNKQKKSNRGIIPLFQRKEHCLMAVLFLGGYLSSCCACPNREVCKDDGTRRSISGGWRPLYRLRNS